MHKIKTIDTTKKKMLVIGLVIFVIFALVAGYLAYKSNTDKQSTPGTADTSGINFGPPTEQEKQAAEDHKEDVNKRADLEKNPPTSSGVKTVTPIISSYGQNPDTKNVEVTGYVSDIYESGGNCLLTLTKDGKAVTQATTSIKDVNRTSCPAMIVPAGSLSSGQWSATLTYTSSAAKGTSSSVNIMVK